MIQGQKSKFKILKKERVNSVLLKPSSKYTHMRIEDKNEKGEGYLVIESKEDLDELMKMVIEAYYKLNPDPKRPCETKK